MKYIISTLGCKVNQYETQAMETFLMEKGHERAIPGELAELIIVNTCAVTAESGRKSRQTIRRLRDENPGALVAVCGCYSQIEPDAAEALGAEIVFGANLRTEFVEAIERKIQSGEGCRNIDAPFKRREFELLPAGAMDHRTRAMLKIQDGCVNFCSYCIIPYTRGPVRSAPLELAVEQAKGLAAEGFREIIVTGIEIASWGVDLPGKPGLDTLLTAVCEAGPQLRVRLGSLEPRVITEQFCAAMAKLPNLCPQFHLSMQSGCDTVLERMKRKYDTARYLESVELLYKHFPGCAVTTDMIVAFPGETEEEFEQSLAFIEKCRFADMHVFPYSRRPGTPADKMPGQHSNAVKEDRSRRAIAVAEQMNKAYREAMIGTKQEVLFEEEQDGMFAGHAPNYMKIYVKGKDLHNKILTVSVEKIHKDGLFATEI